MSFEIVVVGTSLGGLDALTVLLPALPADFPLPVIVAFHRSKDRNPSLANFLEKCTQKTIEEPDDKAAIVPGHFYLAPADYHLLIDDHCFALSTEAPVHHSRPSIDVLFQSAADCYGEAVVGVILTGASNDGALGAQNVEETGGLVIIQDPDEAEAGTLPGSALRTTKNPRVMPLREIAPYLVSLCSIRT